MGLQRIFCFQLSTKEVSDLRFHFGTAKLLSSIRRYNPYVYTEEGIIALAGVLKLRRKENVQRH